MDSERLETNAQLRPYPSRKSPLPVHLNTILTLKDHSSRIQRVVSNIDEHDASSRYREEEGDNKVAVKQEQHSSSSSVEERVIVAWEENDKENPYNWSNVRDP